ncbi:MAG TPA: class I SAM-dependent methyltransferase [Puia sp.]|nr:class I SAM-dependent methyltransferase [Puia sp.]
MKSLMVSNKLLRVRIQDLLRKAGLLSLAEKFRYYEKTLSLRKANRTFIARNPDFRLPPEDIAFDAYSAPDWDFYKRSGEGSAVFLAEMIRKYLPGNRSLAVYEWGCGPGRVIRHLPGQLGPASQVYGTDYNPKTINWCKNNLPGIRFELNELNPPLPFADNSFDFIYCLSVFTHLSEQTGISWAREIYRVLKPGGVFLATTAGDNSFETELLSKEKDAYQLEGVVVRGNYEEGKKMYLARHSPKYVRERLLQSFQIEEHGPSGFPFMQQDYWIARKKGAI